MISEIINITLQGLAALAIYGALVVAYTILSAWANINVYEINQSFDRKKWINGLAKWGLLGVAVLITLVAVNATITLAPSWGVDLANAQQVSEKVIFAVLVAGIFGMAVKNIAEIANILNVKKDLLDKIKQTAVNTPVGENIVLDVADLPDSVSTTASEQALEQSLVSKTVAEVLAEVGGRGSAASVDTGSWQGFLNNVNGRAYDVDGYYGAQCWDGAALFWLNAVGRSFSTGGTGAARGGWEAARSVNAGSEFELITDRNAIQAGDWLVFGGSQWGHVGMATSGNLGNYVTLLGQNQTGTGNGAAFNVINMSLNNFLGAFRLKRWHVAPTPAPTPAPQPQPAPAPAPTPTPAVEIPATVPNNPAPDTTINVNDSVIAWGVGTSDSYGGGATTADYSETLMKVIGINNGRYGLNQYNLGEAGNVPDVTGWWAGDQIRKA